MSMQTTPFNQIPTATENQTAAVQDAPTPEQVERLLRTIEQCREARIRLEARRDETDARIKDAVQELQKLGYDEKTAEEQIAAKKAELKAAYETVEQSIPYDLLERLGVKVHG